MFWRLRRSWIGLLTVLARHRASALSVLSVVASVAAAMAAQHGKLDAWAWVALGTFALIILASAVDTRYANAAILAALLPAIHRALGLSEHERIAVHHIRGIRTHNAYEQLTDYYPQASGAVRGRRFPLSHGIVGQCFQNRRAYCWAIPAGQTFEGAMKERWSFNEEELVRLTRDRTSFMTVPIGQEGIHAKAVLYLDSPDASRFTEQRLPELSRSVESVFLRPLEETIRAL